jgi:Kef-type K+ transport systems, membrane components
MTLISSIFILLFVALVVGELLNRSGVPSVVGELLTGLVLGPAILGIVKPNQVYSGISEGALFFHSSPHRGRGNNGFAQEELQTGTRPVCDELHDSCCCHVFCIQYDLRAE